MKHDGGPCTQRPQRGLSPSPRDLERVDVTADDASSAMRRGRVARRRKQTKLPQPAKPGGLALDRSLVGAFIDAAVRDPDKARDMLKKTPTLLSAPWIHEETPLHFLAIENYLGGVRLLVQLGMDVNAVNEFGNTALTEVVTLGNVQMVEELLRLGANPNVTSEIGTNPLHAAMENDRWEIARILIQAGARIDYRDKYGETFADVLPEDEATRESILEVVGKRDGRQG
jgi:hypothetical protein